MHHTLLARLMPICLFIICSHSAAALHIKGGWMYYSYLGEGQAGSRYEVIVKVYRDCNPPNSGQNDLDISISFFRNEDQSYFTNITAPLYRQYPLSKTSFNECIAPRPEVCYVIIEFRGEVELPHTAQGYIASFQRCCRISGINNIMPPSNAFGNTYTLQFPGTKSGLSNLKNSSPVFSENDTVVVCHKAPFKLDYSATDPDGDSLSYELTPALEGAESVVLNPFISNPPPYSSLPYATGFTAEHPLGTSLTINPGSGIINGISPDQSGEYVLAVLVKEYRKGLKIAETRKELHVNVAACTLLAAELPAQIVNCQDFSVAFLNRSGSPAITSYFWDFGVGGSLSDTSVLPTPVFNYPDTGIYNVKLVVNRNSGCADSASSQVRIFPGFKAGFMAEGSCFSNPFLFTDTSRCTYGTVNFWKWDFGNPASILDTSGGSTCAYHYPVAGNYPLSFIAGSSKGCRDTLSRQIAVLEKPLLTPAFNDTTICKTDSLQLMALGQGNFSWAPASSLQNAHAANPVAFPLKTTRYLVQLEDRGCMATAFVNVKVLDSITADAGADTTICLTDSIVLSPKTQGKEFLWSPAQTLDNASVKNAVAKPVENFTIYKLITRLGKCQARDSIIVKTVPYPRVNAGKDSTICFGSMVHLQGNTNGSSWQWQPGTVLNNDLSLYTTGNLRNTTEFILTATDTLGCPKPATDKVSIMVMPRIIVNAGRDTSLVFGQPLQLNARANAPEFSWSPPVGLDNVLIDNPVATFNATNTLPGQDFLRYTVTATTPMGCHGTDEIIVKIFKSGPSIYVPSGFTPDGNGLNDFMKPILTGMKKLDYFRIYNRFGRIIFETRQIGDGWNGNVQGAPQGVNSFIYECQATDYLDKIIKQSGTFVLIK